MALNERLDKLEKMLTTSRRSKSPQNQKPESDEEVKVDE